MSHDCLLKTAAGLHLLLAESNEILELFGVIRLILSGICLVWDCDKSLVIFATARSSVC